MTNDEACTSVPMVGVVMGSVSDLEVMRRAIDVLDELEIGSEVRIVSAHRTPHEMLGYAEGAADRGIRVIIAGAGGAAHLPGMLASATDLPVVGVPVPLANLGGLDSLLSIVQMPAGVPVATVGVGNARNAALLAARILALMDARVAARVRAYRTRMHDASVRSDEDLLRPPEG